MTISIGNFFNQNGKNIIGSAGGSGLDTQALMKSLTDARTAATITPLQDNVTLNNNKISALSQFQTLLTTLQDSVNQLRNVPGFNTASQNAFKYVTTNVSSNTSTAGSTYLSVTASPGAAAQSYTVNTVTQLALATKQATGVFNVASADTAVVAASSTPNMFTAGAVTITTNTGSANITINTGDGLNQVASEFNAVQDKTGISANVLQVAAGQYELVFTAAKTGTVNAFDISTANTLGQVSDPSGVLQNVGISNSQAAKDAKFTLDNVQLTRSSNSISDAISGLTFNLLQQTPNGTTLSVSVTPDTSTAESAIVNFMNAYNAIKQFAANQNQRNPDGTQATGDYLANDNNVNSTIQTIAGYLANIVPGISSGNYQSLADVGITFTDAPATTDSTGKVTQAATSNVLTYDKTKLESSLSSNFGQVATLFQLTLSSNNSNLSVFTGPSSLPANNIILTINPGTSTYQATYLDSGGTPQTVNLTATATSNGSGYTLTAPTGALNGMVLLYGSTNSATVNLNGTQGVADSIYQYTAAFLQQNTGALAIEQNALKTSTTTLQTQIATQTNALDSYQTQLLAQFSALEKAIAQSNSLLQYFTAQLGVQNSKSG